MRIIDEANNIVGLFKIELIKKDGSIEKYEEKNLIMDNARSNMAMLIGGYKGGSCINRLVLGTKGHIDSDILNFKPVGSNGFDSTRTQIFSEESNDFSYEINFNVKSDNFVELDSLAISNMVGSNLTNFCEVKRSVLERAVKYEIEIPLEGANPIDGSVAIPYTEAGLYADNMIFSQKTFPAVVKDDTCEIRIEWTILF